jgi:hypothetical protein
MALDPDAAAHVWALQPLNTAIVTAFNQKLTIDDVQTDIDEIG